MNDLLASRRSSERNYVEQFSLLRIVALRLIHMAQDQLGFVQER
jgi:hypothetical protein